MSRVVLTIAGSDSIGGAGIQADLKTASALGAHVLTVLTAVTAQNSLEVKAVHFLPPEFIGKQIEAVVEDVHPDAVKIGMLGKEEAVLAVIKAIRKYGLQRVVVDPVIRSSTGATLLAQEALDAMKTGLFPLATIITPNIPEAEALCSLKVRTREDMIRAAQKLKATGAESVVITGGHLGGEAADLFYDGKTTVFIGGQRVEARNDHGSGCVFSTALATYLAKGKDALEATKLAHEFTKRAIISGYRCGKGKGVVNPFFRCLQEERES